MVCLPFLHSLKPLTIYLWSLAVICRVIHQNLYTSPFLSRTKIIHVTGYSLKTSIVDSLGRWLIVNRGGWDVKGAHRIIRRVVIPSTHQRFRPTRLLASNFPTKSSRYQSLVSRWKRDANENAFASNHCSYSSLLTCFGSAKGWPAYAATIDITFELFASSWYLLSGVIPTGNRWFSPWNHVAIGILNALTLPLALLK